MTMAESSKPVFVHICRRLVKNMLSLASPARPAQAYMQKRGYVGVKNIRSFWTSCVISGSVHTDRQTERHMQLQGTFFGMTMSIQQRGLDLKVLMPTFVNDFPCKRVY